MAPAFDRTARKFIFLYNKQLLIQNFMLYVLSDTICFWNHNISFQLFGSAWGRSAQIDLGGPFDPFSATRFRSAVYQCVRGFLCCCPTSMASSHFTLIGALLLFPALRSCRLSMAFAPPCRAYCTSTDPRERFDRWLLLLGFLRSLFLLPLRSLFLRSLPGRGHARALPNTLVQKRAHQFFLICGWRLQVNPGRHWSARAKRARALGRPKPTKGRWASV